MNTQDQYADLPISELSAFMKSSVRVASPLMRQTHAQTPLRAIRRVPRAAIARELLQWHVENGEATTPVVARALGLTGDQTRRAYAHLAETGRIVEVGKAGSSSIWRAVE